MKAWFCHPLGYHPPLQQVTTLDSWLQLLSFPSSLSKVHRLETFCHISFLLWNIWKHRCHCVFNHVLPNPTLVASAAFAASTEFLLHHSIPFPVTFSHHPSPRPPPKPIIWSPPPLSCIKINYVASWKTGQAGLAVLARDAKGSLIAGQIAMVLAPSPLYAGALASLLSVQLALSLQASHFILEADSLHLVNLLNNSTLSTDWSVMPLLDYIRDLAVALPSYSWRWTSSLANQAANHIACLVIRRKCPVDWVHQPPSSFSHILLYDAGPAPT